MWHFDTTMEVVLTVVCKPRLQDWQYILLQRHSDPKYCEGSAEMCTPIKDTNNYSCLSPVYTSGRAMHIGHGMVLYTSLILVLFLKNTKLRHAASWPIWACIKSKFKIELRGKHQSRCTEYVNNKYINYKRELPLNFQEH